MQRFSWVVLIGCLLWGASLWAADSAVGSLSQVEGKVEVKSGKTTKLSPGQVGMFLYEHDLITTSKGGRASILFRDGTELRLFEKTEFLIEAAQEAPTKARSFQYKFMMKLGSLWGQFAKGRQETELRTSTATIGVRGTALRMTETGQEATLSLTEGNIQVSNGASTIELKPGQWIKGFTKTDQLDKKVEDIPYKLLMKTENYRLEFKGDQSQLVRLSIQVTNIQDGQNVRKSGKLYLGSSYYNVRFPTEIMLDQNGFARVPVEVMPPKADDQQFDGKVVIWAVMDDVQATDVGEGTLLLKLNVPGKTHRLQIDADSGAVQQVQ